MRENAVMVSGNMTTKKGKAEREKAIEDMRSGKKKYLFATYSLAKRVGYSSVRAVVLGNTQERLRGYHTEYRQNCSYL